MAIVLSICIPTYQRKGAIAATLESLIGVLEAHGGEIEACVSDNGSTDGTYEALGGFAKRCKFIKIRKNEKNLGFDNNLVEALKMASGEYCWAVGDDTGLVPSRIGSLVEFIKSKQGGEFMLGIIACNLGAAFKIMGRLFPSDEYSRGEFMAQYEKYVDEAGMTGSELTGYMSSFLFKRKLAIEACSRIKEHCFGWCHLIIFLHVLSKHEGRVMVYRTPLMENPATAKRMREDVLLPGQEIELFIDRKLSALSSLPLDAGLAAHLARALEKERNAKYAKAMMKLIAVKDMISPEVYQKLRERMKTTREKMKYGAAGGALYNMLDVVEGNWVLSKIAGKALLLLPGMGNVVRSVESHQKKLVATNQERDNFAYSKRDT